MTNAAAHLPNTPKWTGTNALVLALSGIPLRTTLLRAPGPDMIIHTAVKRADISFTIFESTSLLHAMQRDSRFVILVSLEANLAHGIILQCGPQPHLPSHLVNHILYHPKLPS